MRKYLPCAVTYLSLTCGIFSILQAVQGNLLLSGVLVLCAYIFDSVDGELARRLNAASDFGLQLDSLSDMVVFGVAAPFLVFQHLSLSILPWWISGIGMILFCMGGIFRLARFNLYAGKPKQRNTTGLTISTSGAYLALTVLVDQAFDSSPIPAWAFLLVYITLALLMVSRVKFPELQTILRHRLSSLAILGTSAIAAIWLTPQLVWFSITTLYISFGIGRAAYRRLT